MAEQRDAAPGVLAAVQRLAVGVVTTPVTLGFIALGAGILVSRSLGQLVEQAIRLLPSGDDEDHGPKRPRR